MKQRRAWRRWAAGALALAFLVVGGGYLWHQRALLAARVELEAGYLLPLLLAEVATLGCRGLLTRELCRRFEVRLGVVESFLLASWATMANYAAPLVGGAGLRAVYLRRRHGLSYAHFASLHGSVFALQAMVAAALGSIGLAWLHDTPQPARWTLASLYLAVLAGGAVLLRLPVGTLAGEGRWARRLGQVSEGFDKIRSRGLAILLALVVCNLASVSASLYCAFALLGARPGPAETVVVASASVLSLVVALTPGGFGITESVIVFVAAPLGLLPAIAVAAAGSRRGAALVVTAAAAVLGSSRFR